MVTRKIEGVETVVEMAYAIKAQRSSPGRFNREFELLVARADDAFGRIHHISPREWAS